MRSVRVRPDLVQRVKLSVKGNGFFRQKDLVEAVGLADSTVRNFLGGKPVDYATFVEICQKLNLEWKDFADLGEVAKFDQESEAVLALSQTELSSKPTVLDQSQLNQPVSDKKEHTLEASHKIEAISFLEYFSKSIDQLKSKELDVRIGAISTLGTLVKYSQPAEHWTIMEYLTDFVRTNAPRKEEKEGEEERSLKLREDIQAALTVIGRRDIEKDEENKVLNLRNSNIRGADLREAKLQRLDFRGCDLQGTTFRGAYLEWVGLNKAKPTIFGERTDHLEGEIYQEVSFIGANLKDAFLMDAKLKGADFQRANLEKVNFNAANLEKVKFSKANLKGSFLLGAKNLELQEIAQAFGDNTTVLPNDIATPAHWI